MAHVGVEDRGKVGHAVVVQPFFYRTYTLSKATHGIVLAADEEQRKPLGKPSCPISARNGLYECEQIIIGSQGKDVTA